MIISAALILGLANSVRSDQPVNTYSVLAVETRDIPFYSVVLDAFDQGLKARSEGYRIRMTSIAMTGNEDQDTKALQENLKKNPQLILTLGTDATLLVAAQHPTVPVLCSMILNPVSLGVAKSLSSPGGDFTGTTLLVNPGKQFDALQQIMPNIKTIGVLCTQNDPTSTDYIDEAEVEAKQLGIKIVALPVPNGSAVDPALIEQLAQQADAIWLIPDPASMAPPVLDLTLKDAFEHHIPVLGDSSANVKSGALLALSADTQDMGDLDSQMAVSLLQGSSPAEMRIRGPRKMTLSINLQAAQAIGVTIPDSILRLADSVINTQNAQK